SQTSPNFWLDPRNGVSYPLMAMMPQYDVNSLQALANIPVAQSGGSSGATTAAALASAGGAGPAPQNLLGALSTLTRGTQQAVVSHYNVQPVLDIFASAQGRDLGGVAADVNRLVDQIRPQLPPGASIVVRGQVQAMHDSFSGLASGLVFAIGLVYLLMVVNFQS
ncbi:AcrB/AcrD/AcrF family protein, partial [Paraburkholderia xenovorans]